MKKIFCRLALTCMAVMIPAVMIASDPKTIETDWVWRPYFSNSSAASSTHSVTGVGFSYALRAVGADVSFTISQTTATYRDGNICRSTSSVIIVPSGSQVNSTFEAYTLNPSIIIHGMNTAATAYVWINYGEKAVR